MNCPDLHKSKKKFRITKGKKSRVITCYAQNDQGNQLRKYHEHILPLLNSIYCQFTPENSYAYQEGKNCKQLVERHLDSKYFIKLDILSYFPSIHHEYLINIISENINENNREEISQLVKSCSSTERGLDIGMVPSGVLSNIYLANFDNVVSKKLDNNCIFSRYADDIIISSKHELDVPYIEHLIIKELSNLKLQINPSKTSYIKLLKKQDHIKILGLNIVHGDELHEGRNYITVSRKFKKKAYKEKQSKKKLGMLGYIKYNQVKDDCAKNRNN